LFEVGSEIVGSIIFPLGTVIMANEQKLPWMNMMIAIPVAAIPLITPLFR
jgi:uncharacterized membrane protein